MAICKKCGTTFRTSARKTICIDCREFILPTSRVINEYNTRAPRYLDFKDDKKDSIGKMESKRPVNSNSNDNYSYNGVVEVKEYFGIEIELESSVATNERESEAIRLYESVSGHTKKEQYILCKHDGSLLNGLEIITCPATINVHKEKLKELCEALKTTTLQALKSCGLHIHVARNSVTTLQLGKVMDFINRKDNHAFIKAVAERNSSDFARLDEESTITSVAPDVIRNISTNRYKAVNLSNKETIEFRMFASSNKYENIVYKLEFLKALLDYTRTGNSDFSLKELVYVPNFCSFVGRRKKDYPFFYTFLCTAGWITPDKKKTTYEDFLKLKGKGKKNVHRNI